MKEKLFLITPGFGPWMYSIYSQMHHDKFNKTDYRMSI